MTGDTLRYSAKNITRANAAVAALRGFLGGHIGTDDPNAESIVLEHAPDARLLPRS